MTRTPLCPISAQAECHIHASSLGAKILLVVRCFAFALQRLAVRDCSWSPRTRLALYHTQAHAESREFSCILQVPSLVHRIQLLHSDSEPRLSHISERATHAAIFISFFSNMLTCPAVLKLSSPAASFHTMKSPRGNWRWTFHSCSLPPSCMNVVPLNTHPPVEDSTSFQRRLLPLPDEGSTLRLRR